jgi:hypothetical protein
MSYLRTCQKRDKFTGKYYYYRSYNDVIFRYDDEWAWDPYDWDCGGPECLLCWLNGITFCFHNMGYSNFGNNDLMIDIIKLWKNNDGFNEVSLTEFILRILGYGDNIHARIRGINALKNNI